MALPRKKSRRIVVDDVVYRWAVRLGQLDEHGTGWLSITIDAEEPGGEVLLVRTTSRDFWLDFGDLAGGKIPWQADNYPVVTPSLVKQLVRMARGAGWSPALGSGTRSFTLELSEGKAQLRKSTFDPRPGHV